MKQFVRQIFAKMVHFTWERGDLLSDAVILTISHHHQCSLSMSWKPKILHHVCLAAVDLFHSRSVSTCKFTSFTVRWMIHIMKVQLCTNGLMSAYVVISSFETLSTKTNFYLTMVCQHSDDLPMANPCKYEINVDMNISSLLQNWRTEYIHPLLIGN